jgi:four helix bundle protein
VPILEVCRRRKLISDQQADKLKANLEEISKMINGLIKGLENRNTA